MRTEALFREDAYLGEAEARVVAINDRGGILLDRTIFYATSGGQPGDTGRLLRADGGTRIAVRLSISDNGPGFAPKILANAFEPYVTSKAKGTGLGLAMVKKIIEEHGGRIDIQNRDDSNGASVLILLLKLAPV